MSLKHRIGRLEDEAGPERCDNCRGWGNTLRIIYRHSDGTSSEPYGPPERCESCGYEPVTIIIEYTHEAAKL